MAAKTTKVPTRSGLARTLSMARPRLGGQKKLMALGVLALLAEVVFRVLEPWPLKFVIDAVTASLGADLAGDAPSATVQFLVLMGLCTLAFVGGRALCNYGATVAFALVGSRVATRLRRDVFERTQLLSEDFHGRHRSGDVVQRLVGDVGKLQDVSVTAGLPLIANVITLFAMSGVMLWLDPLLALVVVVCAAMFAVVQRFSSPRITQAARKTRQSEGMLANSAQESLGAIKVVKAYGLEEIMTRTFSSANQKSLTEGVKSKRLAAGLERSTDLIVGLGTAVVIALGGWRVLQGAMTPGDLVIFITYLKTAMKPLRDLAKYTGRIARATASGERVADLMEAPMEIRDPEVVHAPRQVYGYVQFDHVTAEYVPGRPVLTNLSLHIPAGQSLAVIGPSGAGKSTLTSLLLRSMDPVGGAIRLDYCDLRTYALSDLRRRMAFVLQESVLFTGTIAQNIEFGRPGATREEIEAAARRAQLHDHIMTLPEGYDTWVGERGSTLSGGQRQRMAIARAILRDASVVVLDEALTGLDPRTGRQVKHAIDELARGRTTISITHDAATALEADRVIWIEDGTVLLDGSPEALWHHSSDRFRTWVTTQRAAQREQETTR